MTYREITVEMVENTSFESGFAGFFRNEYQMVGLLVDRDGEIYTEDDYGVTRKMGCIVDAWDENK